MPGWDHEVLRDCRCRLSRLRAERGELAAALAASPEPARAEELRQALARVGAEEGAEAGRVEELETRLGVHRSQAT